MTALRLVLGIPSGPQWSAHFGNCLVHLCCHLSREIPGFDEQQFALINRRGSILPKIRHDILKQALQDDATHLLFLDTDQTFPATTVEQLLKHKKRIVAANISTKMIPPNPTARQESSSKISGDLVYSTPTSNVLEKVWRVGTGIMLIDLSIFKLEAMKHEPWFDTTYSEKTGDYRGEDWFFCERLEAANIGIWVDHRLSYEVGHVGELEYDHVMVNRARQVERKVA